jgi:hypothetical protein
VDRTAVHAVRAGEFVDGIQREPVKPWLESEALRFFAPLLAVGILRIAPECGGNGFVDNFFLADGIGRDLTGNFAEVNLALNEPLQPRQIHVYIPANIFGRNGFGEDDRQRLFEGNRTHAPDVAPAHRIVLTAGPLVPGSQLFFVFVELLQEIVEGDFDRGIGRGGGSLRGHLAGGQTQVQRNAGAFGSRRLFHHALQMDKLRAKGLKPLSQFFDLMLKFFF